MKRWDYNTLKGEVWLFAVFLAMMMVQVAGTFYIFFFADSVCHRICMDIGSPESSVLLTWASRVAVAFHMGLAGWGFYEIVKNQGNI